MGTVTVRGQERARPPTPSTPRCNKVPERATSPPRQAGGLVEQRAWACTQGLPSGQGTAFHDTNGGIMFTGSQDRAPTNRQLHIEERGRGTPVSKVDDRTNAAD